MELNLDRTKVTDDGCAVIQSKSFYKMYFLDDKQETNVQTVYKKELFYYMNFNEIPESPLTQKSDIL